MEENKNILDNVSGELTEEASETAQAAAEEAAETAEEAAETAEDAAEETENPTEADGTPAEEEAAEAADDAFGDGFDGVTESEPEAAEAPKKKLLMKPIVISIAIVVIAVVAALAVNLFFNSGIEGTWHYSRTVSVMDDGATSDEPSSITIDYYFDFGSDGTLTETIGTVTSKGTYETHKTEDGKAVMTVTLTDPVTSGNFYDGELLITTGGNIFTGRKLTLTSTEDETVSIELVRENYTAPEIPREGEFTPSEELTGTWVYDVSPYYLTYEFRSDGTAVYHQVAPVMNYYTYTMSDFDITMSGIYDYTSDTITMSYYFTQMSSQDIQYTVKDKNTLIINNFEFVRQGTSTADSAE